jgi:hypothetical protein
MMNNSHSALGKGKTRNRAISSHTQEVDAESASIAAYIGDMSAEMALLASRGKLPMLAYFLNLAHAEAQIYVREQGRPEFSSAKAERQIDELHLGPDSVK